MMILPSINIGQLAWNVQEVTASPMLNVNLDLYINRLPYV